MPQPKPVIWGVLSDLGKVYVDFDNHRACAALEPHSSAYTADELHERMFKRDHRPLWDACMRGQIAYPDFRNEMKRRLQLTCSDAAFDRAVGDVFTVNEPVAALWRELRARHVRIVTASNIEPIRHERLLAMGVMDAFDGHCLSYLEQVGKPDLEFFRRGLAAIGTEPHETLFVDDHPEFCEAARKLGIHAEPYDQRDHQDFVRRLGERYLFA